jgi:hypothetical protein
VALGCNTVHMVVTQCAALLRHICVAQRRMSRKTAVMAQMWAWAWTRLRCRCGRGMDSLAVQRRARDRLGPGADVGGYEPSPVASDERSPKCRCGRIGASRTKPRCAAHPHRAEERPTVHRDYYSAAGVSTQQTRHSVRRRRCSEGRHGGLRPVAAVSGAQAAAAADGVGVAAAASRGCAGMQQLGLRCNGLCCVAKVALLQQIAQRSNMSRSVAEVAVRVRVRADGPNGKETLAGKCPSGNGCKWEVPKRERLSGNAHLSGLAPRLLR